MMWKALLGPNGLRDRVAELHDLLNGVEADLRPGTVCSGKVLALARGREH